MTKGAQVLRQIASNEAIERAKRSHDTRERVKDRELTRSENEARRKTDLYAASIGALGRMGSTALKANHPEWYKAYVKNLDDFVKVPTFDRLGAGRICRLYGIARYNNDIAYAEAPGVLTLHWIPVIGPQRNGTTHFMNPINQTLARLREQVLSLNSRSSVNWEAADIGLNLFASVDILGMIFDLGRVIKVYRTYHAKNAYFAEYLIRSLGWNYTDIQDKFADYRKAFKLAARKFNASVVLPADLGLVKRRAYLASNIFADSADEKYPRQVYAFVQTRKFTLNDNGDGCVVSSMSRTLSGMQSDLNLAFARISDNPDFAEMYQDLRHAFRGRLATIDEEYADSEIVCNTEALNREQIHNLKTLPGRIVSNLEISTTINTNIGLHIDTQGYLYQGKPGDSAQSRVFELPVPAALKPFAKAYIELDFGSDGGALYNMHKEIPSGDDILDITRSGFTLANVTEESTDRVSFMLESCGTEVFTSTGFHQVIFDNLDTHLVDVYCANWNLMQVGATNSTYLITRLLAMRSAFDWAPIHKDWGIDINLPIAHHMYTLCDTHTTFPIYNKELKDINFAAVMGEIYVDDSFFSKQ